MERATYQATSYPLHPSAVHSFRRYLRNRWRPVELRLNQLSLVDPKHSDRSALAKHAYETALATAANDLTLANRSMRIAERITGTPSGAKSPRSRP